MFRAFANIQAAEMLNLPRPNLNRNKFNVFGSTVPDELHSKQQEQEKRYERIRSEMDDPHQDNARPMAEAWRLK